MCALLLLLPDENLMEEEDSDIPDVPSSIELSEEEEPRTREEEAMTPQSCNFCSPCSRSKVEKRCCFLFLQSFGFSWKEA